jgi:glycosyltransferase 2 family protein
MSKTVTIAIALIGLALATVVVTWLGADKVWHAILTLGWRGMCWVVLWQLAVFCLLGVAWWILATGASLPIVIWARLVREGAENCLPFSEIGGMVFGARALVLGGAGFAPAVASSVADVVTEGIGLVPFLVFGLVVLALKGHTSYLVPMAAGLAVLLIGGGLAFAFRTRLARLFHLGMTKLMRNWTKNAPQCADELEHTIQCLFHQRWRVAGAAAVHFLSWCGGGGNIWIAYHLLGAHLSVVDALAIEGILSSIMGVGFLVPGALGIQEVSYIGLGAAFGLPSHLSLSLSFIRRARNIIIGIPPLVAWQMLEARQLRRDS